MLQGESSQCHGTGLKEECPKYQKITNQAVLPESLAPVEQGKQHANAINPHCHQK